MVRTALHLSGIEEADELLSSDPLALLIGMVLDQQFPLERAFASPAELQRRLGKKLDAHELASMDPDALAKIFTKPPALHRFPGSMAGRVQAMCQVLVDEYGSDAANVWKTKDAAELFKRIKALPGFGEQKAKIFVALLGKQLGVRPPGWEGISTPYGEPGSRRSIADIVDADTLLEVRAFKKAMKAKAASEQPDPKPAKSSGNKVAGKKAAGRPRAATAKKA